MYEEFPLFISSVSNTKRLKPKVGRIKSENGFANVIRKAGPIPNPRFIPEPENDSVLPFDLTSILLKKSRLRRRLKPASNLLSQCPK